MALVPRNREELQTALVGIKAQGATDEQLRSFVSETKQFRPNVDFSIAGSPPVGVAPVPVVAPTPPKEPSLFERGVARTAEFLRKTPGFKQITRAGEAVRGQVESAAERAARGGRQIKEAVTEAPFAEKPEEAFRGALGVLGGAGEAITAPFAAPFGLAEPLIQTAVTELAGLIPDAAKQKAAEILEAIPEEQKQSVSDLFAATGLLLPISAPARIAGREVAAAAVKPIVKPIARVAGALEEAAELGIVAERQTFARELTRPIRTKGVKEAEVPRTTEKGQIIVKSEIEPTAMELRAQKAVENIEGVSEKKSFQQNFNVIDEANKAEAIRLKAALEANDFIFPRQELTAKLAAAKKSLADNPLLVGDAQKSAQKLIDQFEKIFEGKAAKGSSLLEARKEFDAFVRSQKPKIFDVNTENALNLANREIRTTINNFLDEKAIGVGVKESLARQSALFDALENIVPKAAQEADDTLGRIVDKIDGVLGTRNRAVQGLAVLGATGAFSATERFAKPVTALFATLLGFNKLGKLVTSPQLKKRLASALRELEKKATQITDPIQLREIADARELIESFTATLSTPETEAAPTTQ